MIKDVENFIANTVVWETKNHQSVQTDIECPELNREFIEFLYPKAKFVFIDELGGFHRVRSEKTYEEVIERVDENSNKAGIKVCHAPTMKLHEWEDWDTGYIEGFVRTSESYFIWLYIPMEHLEEIIETYKNCLTDYWELS